MRDTPAHLPSVHEHKIFPSICVLQMEKWGSKPSTGERVWPTRFIPSKTPLTVEHIVAHFSSLESCPNPHTVAGMLEQCHSRHMRVGMIMNISAHGGMYAADVPPELPTFHVSMESKHLPSRQQVQMVIERAVAFWEQDPEAYIVLHCAYGAYQRPHTEACVHACMHTCMHACGTTPPHREHQAPAASAS
jgi:hypothetical protein